MITVETVENLVDVINLDQAKGAEKRKGSNDGKGIGVEKRGRCEAVVTKADTRYGEDRKEARNHSSHSGRPEGGSEDGEGT